MMSLIWSALFFIGTVVTTFRFGGDAALSAMLNGAQKSVTLCLSLGGAYMLWMGILGVAKEAGLMNALSKLLRRPCEWLFPGAGEATGAITLNIAANMLGMGNAATPFGLEAMRIMQKKNKDKARATDAMCVFLAVNASALQIIPTTMIALRGAAGSLQPAAIVTSSLLSSAIATFVTIVVCRMLVLRP
ncbi:hypothetical protein LJC27_02650 [Christensenellaceae bacterium OttesenSCG-928-M15]|nr:hypothetical protein [Christensenellaceae bacterium OttesenSCG-928-M15]